MSTTVSPTDTTAATRGVADHVHDAQAVFRAVLDAMARPGTIHPVTDAHGGAPYEATAAAVMAMLADHETTVWLDAPLAARPEVADHLRFTTGTRIVAEPIAATFALVSDPATMPPLAAFASGTPEYPDRSTTLVLMVARLGADGADALTLAGPGIPHTAALAVAPQPADLAAQLVANRARFPMGVDLILVAPGEVAALPRSVRIVDTGGAEPCTSR
jgi:alpha-D-ribose 1-methylphosphonate 5-triphosphate synthase subunit PhnH